MSSVRIGSGFFVASYLVASAFHGASASGDEGLRARFLSEAPAAWRALAEGVGSYEGTRVMRTVRAASQPPEVSKVDFKFAEDLALAITDDGSRVTAHGMNRRYAFELRRIGETEWIIAKLARKGDPGHGELVDYALKASRGCLTSGTSLFPRRLPQLVQEPTFKVTDVRAVRLAGEELAEVQFAYDPKDKSDLRIREARLILNPARSWTVREGRAQVDWPSEETGTVSQEVIYYDDFAPVPVVKTFRARSEARPAGPRAKELGITGPTTLEITSEFDVRPLERPDERDFSLTAFGLPEPDGTSPSLWWLWALIAGVVLLALALWLGRGAVGRLGTTRTRGSP